MERDTQASAPNVPPINLRLMDMPRLDHPRKHLRVAPLAKPFGEEGVVYTEELLEGATHIRVPCQRLDHHPFDRTQSHYILLIQIAAPGSVWPLASVIRPVAHYSTGITGRGKAFMPMAGRGLKGGA